MLHKTLPDSDKRFKINTVYITNSIPNHFFFFLTTVYKLFLFVAPLYFPEPLSPAVHNKFSLFMTIGHNGFTLSSKNPSS